MERYRYSPEQQRMLEGMSIPFAVYQFVDRRVVTLVVSDGFCEVLGYDDRAQAYYDMDNDMYRDTHPDDVARIADAAVRFATQGGTYEVFYRYRKRSGGEYRILHAQGRHVYSDTGVRLAQVWYTDEGPYIEDDDQSGAGLHQMLSRALHEESILKASHYDELTGLPSMSYFFELADAGKLAIQREGGQPAMLFLDLSGMKFFNQKNGFAEGNRLLQAFAKALSHTFSSENCCRIGVDHFAAFTREEGLEDVLKALFVTCEGINDGKTLPVRVGIYCASMEDVATTTACDRAKYACDAIRKTYASSYNYFNAELLREARRRDYIQNNLDAAIEKRWIEVYYQPIVRAANGRVCDEEALARWNDPVQGFLSPAEFIPYLEDSGLIYKLDLYVLDRVLEKLKRQKEAGLILVSQSVNLSRSDFETCDIVEEIRARVDAAGLPREMITIEITESVIGRDIDFIKDQVDRFQALGFPVWMDDFGSGYSSLDVLQSIRFNLIKFDMSFMRKLEDGDSGRIILTELMKMATALGVDTVCEGVETKEQVLFLQEIGCLKLQGYYYGKPIPFEKIVERYRKGIQIGFENPEESAYYDAIGRTNLYDLSMVVSDDDGAFQNFFNTLPMGIIEVKGDAARFTRSNQSYRDFLKRFFNIDVSRESVNYNVFDTGFMTNVVRNCCEQGGRSFFDEKMPDGSVVHSFARRIGVNPVNGNTAVAVAVLSISDPSDGETYADIARALATDYYNIYVVDLDTEHYIEYTSAAGKEELSMERHGGDFFASARRDTMTRIYEPDREAFLADFSKENVVRALDTKGVYRTTYRLIDDGAPMYVAMKITRMRPGGNRIIMGISIVDNQMKQEEHLKQVQRERDVLARVMALSEDYLTIYTIDPETSRFVEYNATDDYSSIGLAKEGDDIFARAVEEANRVIHPDDLPRFMEQFTRENVMREIETNGVFRMQYRLLIHGEARPVSLRMAPIRENGEEKLVAGVRAWRIRK